MVRIDLLSWAIAVHKDILWWCFEGIQHPSSDLFRRHRGKNINKIAETLCSDCHYMDDLATQEVDYCLTDDCYRDEWEEHVKSRVHTDSRCPHSPSKKEREAYTEELKKMREDEDAKRKWLWRTMFEWDLIRDQVENMVADEEGIMYFLKEHPVSGAMIDRGGEYAFRALDDIVGYCPECGSPATKDDIGPGKELWLEFQCDSCGAIMDIDDPALGGKDCKRPFDWPPGAPFPPRQGFDGTPFDVPPWEA